MGRSHGFSPEQSYEGNISTSNDYVDLQGNVPPFEYQVILDIRGRKTALKTLAKQLQITSGDPEYGTLKDQILQLGVVPKALEGDATYDIGEARTWYGLSEYVPPVESPDPEEGNELGESAPHEITWQKPRNENGGESDPKQKPGHIRLTNNEFNNELTLGKGDKESGRDPSTYIIPTFGRLLGIPEGDDKGALAYKLRLAIEENDRNIPAELQRGELTPENISIWRQKIGLETLSSEQTEPSRDEELAKILNKYFPEDKPGSQGEETTSEVSAEQGIGQDEILSTSETTSSGLDVEIGTLFEGLPGAEVLEQELNGLVDSIVEQERGGKLARIEGREYPGEGELETFDNSAEIEQLKQEAREAIQKYKKFGDTHAPNLRTESVQNVYRQLETDAWGKVEKLSHKLDGHLSRKLPQLRDILTAHKDLTNISDAKDFLVSTETVKLNPEGNITHIIDNEGNEVELNRPRTFEEIFAKSRPVRVLYNIDNENKKLGYIIEGLNLNTPDWIEGVLNDNQFLEPIIVDPWDTPIEYILPNTETESSLYPIDKTPKLTPAEELSNVQVKENIGDTSKQDEKLETNSKAQLDNLRKAYARAEELYNRNRNDESAKLELERLRGEYNQTVEEVIGIMSAQGLESEIHRVFTQEVENLREERIVQSQELQSGFEKVINPLKERFVNFAIKHKKIISRLNLVAFGVGTTLALTGFGLPVAGGLAVLRRSVSSLMSGVSSRELARAGFEDGDINLFKGKIKWQAAIPKLVGESLQEGYIKKANDAELSTKLSTLEAYYRLNGGKFTNASQQEAYEAILNELGTRVQHDSIANQAEKEELPTNISKIGGETINSENSNSDEGEVKTQPEKFVFSSPEQNQQYTSRLLTTLSKERIIELQKQQQKRKTADIIGFATGGTLLTIGTLLDAHRASVASKPDIETTPPEQLQDISQLSKGETLWGEIAKQLGPNASPDQIQHALENYVQSGVGQNTMFQLAQGTEGGRGLLAQWGIDNANEMASLSKEQLYEVSRYLAPGQLEGISHFNIDHLEAFQPTEYVAPSPAESPTIEPGYPETPASSPVGTESLGSEPTVPPAAEAPVSALAPEVPPVATSEFTRDLSEALGATNMTETQLQEAIYSFATSEQGSVELYNQIISNEEGARFLSGFGVNSAADFANISPDKVYEIAQTMGVENLDQLPGFELNDILLAKFENAPDTLNLVKGAKPLSLIDNYIVQYTGDLPHSSSLGQEVLTTYLDTPEGKDWLYDAIVNNPEKLTGNQNIQFVEEYFRQKGIKSGADINWTNLTQDKRFPTSIFWRETTLTGGRKIPPLSTLLKPGQMAGIKKALQLVLTKQ
jgi:hypothetical protein